MTNYLISGRDGIDPIALVAIVLSLLTLVWMVWNEFTSYRRRQADEYWYRGVFSPNCVEPLITFLNDHLSGLQSIDVGAGDVETKKFCANFSLNKEALLSKLWVSRLFSAGYYDVACSELDCIEDEMVNTFGGWVIKPKSASGDDLVVLRDSAIGRITAVLANAADINLNKFARKQKVAVKAGAASDAGGERRGSLRLTWPLARARG